MALVNSDGRTEENMKEIGPRANNMVLDSIEMAEAKNAEANGLTADVSNGLLDYIIVLLL